jgi:putative Holliday junction resolvase
MNRWLGIDHGTKRIGIAVGNDADRVATPLAVIPASPLSDVLREIFRYLEEYQAAGIVVGWPLNMDSTVGPQAELARMLALELALRTQADVRMWDERLSSFAADQALAGHFTRKKKKARQDAVAAAAMLQDFFAGDGPQKAPRPGELGCQPLM